MRRLQSEAPGGPETLKLADVPPPVPGPGELLVRVRACAINYPDVLVIEDKYQFRPQRPFAPGGEVCGVVEDLGPDVTGFAQGDRVMAITLSGGLAEMMILPAASAHKVPDILPDTEAAALLMTYGTTIHALVDRGQLQAGQTLLVLGAAGGVGIAAIELGKALGARVVAAVSSEAKAAVARETGADEVVVYPRGPFDKDGIKALSAQFKAAVGPDGADVIYDPVGGDYAEAALRAIAWQGRYLVVGFPAGIPRLPLNLVLLKGCDIRGIFLGEFFAREPGKNQENIARLLTLYAEGKIKPRVSEVYPLERGGEAIARLASREAVGKIVVAVA